MIWRTFFKLCIGWIKQSKQSFISLSLTIRVVLSGLTWVRWLGDKKKAWLCQYFTSLTLVTLTEEFLKIMILLQYSSVQFSRSVVSNSFRPHEPQHSSPPCLSPTPGVHPNPCPLSRWCHPTISSSVIPLSSCPQSFPASGSFQMSQFFASGAKVLEYQLKHQSFQWIIRTDILLDILAVQGTLKILIQHHSSKASILRCSAFFRV